MNEKELLAQAAVLLGQYRRSGSGPLALPNRHHVEVAADGGLDLSVDVFQDPHDVGHVRVHLVNISPEQERRLAAVPGPRALAQLPRTNSARCSACELSPAAYPAVYVQSGRGARRYSGFQWHSPDGFGSADVDRIQIAIAWLSGVAATLR